MIRQILTDLMEYAREHFRTEETYLERFEYAERASHHDEHEKFVRDIGALSAQSDEGGIVSPERVFDYLSSWIGHHLRVVDARYVPLLLARMGSGKG